MHTKTIQTQQQVELASESRELLDREMQFSIVPKLASCNGRLEDAQKFDKNESKHT
jgi:hypothetical protein